MLRANSSEHAHVLKTGKAHAEETDLALGDIVDYRLHETMNPFSFQVILLASLVWCHTGHACGRVQPPPEKPGIDYAGLCDLIDEGLAALQQETHDSIQALSGQNMYFRFGKMEIPFTTDNFLATFSKPNLYFHATTTYTILRQLGTPLGKLDFLGNMKVGH